MPGVSVLRVILPIAIGAGLKSVSSSAAIRGDLAHAIGDNSTALGFHLTALALLLAALACFLYGLISIFRKGPTSRGSTMEPLPASARAPARAADPEAPFDPDAVIARYLASKATAQTEPDRPPPGSFGRKDR